MKERKESPPGILTRVTKTKAPWLRTLCLALTAAAALLCGMAKSQAQTFLQDSWTNTFDTASDTSWYFWYDESGSSYWTNGFNDTSLPQPTSTAGSGSEAFKVNWDGKGYGQG